MNTLRDKGVNLIFQSWRRNPSRTRIVILEIKLASNLISMLAGSILKRPDNNNLMLISISKSCKIHFVHLIKIQSETVARRNVIRSPTIVTMHDSRGALIKRCFVLHLHMVIDTIYREYPNVTVHGAEVM